MSGARLLIEEWLPAAALGVECMRERGSASALAPNTYLHVWWARRPLAVSRAAVLGSLLPADFPRDVFERLLGFWGSSADILYAQALLNSPRATDKRIANPHGPRSFRNVLREDDLDHLRRATDALWGEVPTVIDPMAGGGSIPFEAARLGFPTLANEYNPVACSVLEASVTYPFVYGAAIGNGAKHWGGVLRQRFNARMEQFYPKTGTVPPLTYIFARTVPCPDTGFPTPLVPDWHLAKETPPIVAEPIVNADAGTWSVRIREVGTTAGRLTVVPRPTYDDGTGISLFTGSAIASDYIKAQAQAGNMASALYAVVTKATRGLEFRPPEAADLATVVAAEAELARLRPAWERDNVIPTEHYPEVSSDNRPRMYGMPRWADFFSPRQLLAFGVLVEELRALRPEIIAALGDEHGEAVVHLLAFAIDKFTNYNSNLASWHAPRQVMRSVFDRHDFAFKPTYAEMAPCGAGSGLAWTLDNVREAYEELAKLPRHPQARPVTLSMGSATSLPQLEDGSVAAVVVDPPYAGNVQYSELADFFYVWLKRTQGHRRPEWFSTYLCDHTEEAVVNAERHRTRDAGATPAARRAASAAAKEAANAFYEGLMTEVFTESRRILRDDGALTVMFTHKKQEAWEALFASLIAAGFTITATWPVKTESEHSLHQARKNAAQSTVLLVARKRRADAGVGYFDQDMRRDIRDKATATAQRLAHEGLNAVDQLVGSFGPAMEVYSRYDTVRTDTGDSVAVGSAIEEAAHAVSDWRVAQVAERGLDGVESEGRFALLCWDVLGAAEFRFNEASMLGRAVGMDVNQLIAAGLVTKKQDNILMQSAKDRRRDQALEADAVMDTLFGPVTVPRRRSARNQILQIHPNDPQFRTALDGCHALALRYIEAGGGGAGIGSARGLAQRQQWDQNKPVARLMEALVRAAPVALRGEGGRGSVAARFPEFRAWHALLTPLFGITPLDWTPAPELQPALALATVTALDIDDADPDIADTDEVEDEE